MRSAPLPALLVVLSGCTEIEIDVQIDLPPAYADRVDQLLLTVLEPPVGAAFGCDDLEYGEVAESVLRASALPPIELSIGESVGLPAMDRRADKLFWLQGLQADGLLAVAACAELNEVETSQTVRLDAVIAPSLEVHRPAGQQVVIGQDTLGLFLLDPTGEPAPDVPIRWTVIGAGGATAGGPGSELKTAADGIVGLVLPDLPNAGPALVDIRARWQRNLLDPVTALAPPIVWPAPAATRELATNLETTYVTAVHRLGRAPGFVVVGHDAVTGSAVVHEYGFVPGPDFVPSSPPVSLPDRIAGVATLTGDRPVLVSEGGALLVFSAPGTPVGHPLTPPPANLDAVTGLAVVDGCDSGSASPSLLVRSTTTAAAGRLSVYDSEGQALAASPFNGTGTAAAPDALLAAGCVGFLDGRVRPAVVSEVEQGAQTRLAAIVSVDAAMTRSFELPFVGSGVGMTGWSDTTLPSLVGTIAGTHAHQLTRIQLVEGSAGAQVALHVVAQDPISNVPDSVAAGDLDGDGAVDVVTVVRETRLGPGAVVVLTLILAAEYRDARLAGVFLLQDLVNPKVEVIDFNEDGYDDILIVDLPVAGGSVNATVLFMGPHT